LRTTDALVNRWLLESETSQWVVLQTHPCLPKFQNQLTTSFIRLLTQTRCWFQPTCKWKPTKTITHNKSTTTTKSPSAWDSRTTTTKSDSLTLARTPMQLKSRETWFRSIPIAWTIG
jgi:hypothetical protein